MTAAMDHYFNQSADRPLRLLAGAILVVRGYSLDPHRTREQDEFASVSLDDYERMMLEQLFCATAPEDDDSRDRFLESCGLGYLAPDMRTYASRLREELERGCFFPDDAPLQP